MKRLAVIGANGLVGSALCKYFDGLYKVKAITRQNYDSYIGQAFDIIINANGNSKRYWAAKNVVEDFKASTLSVYKTLHDFRCGLYVFISTADIYEYPRLEWTDELITPDILKQSVYGFHKYLAEIIVQKHAERFLILRCSAMLGGRLKKGVVFDILNNVPLFVTNDSRFQFITVDTVADIVATLIAKDATNGILNIGGEGNTSVKFIEQLVSVNSDVSTDAELQIYNMDVSALKKVYPLKSSDDYLKEFIEEVADERMDRSI